MTTTLHAGDLPTSVQDLRYGAVLYAFYQGDFLAALTELAVAEKRGGFIAHRQGAQLLGGGMRLSYGMDQQAEEIFNRVLTQDVEADVQAQAWYYLGKLLYQRGELLRAKATLDKVSSELPESLQDDYHLQQVLLASLLKGDSTFVQQHLDAIDTAVLRSYAGFNLAMLLRQNGQTAQALDMLAIAEQNQINAVHADDESKALLDRMYLASAYLQLAQKDYPAADLAFRKVRLDGPWSAQALLGFGWSAYYSNQLDAAIAAWELLSTKAVLGPVVQEAFVAIPHVYEKRGDAEKALRAFEKAAVHFEKLHQELLLMSQDIQQRDLVEHWLSRDIGEGWLSGDSGLNVAPENPYLVQMMADQAFQSSLKDLRDLAVLRNNLLNWKGKIVHYRYMLETRELAYQQRVEDYRAAQTVPALENIKQERNRLAQRITEARQNNDSLMFVNERVFADEQQLKLLAILRRAETLLEQLANQEAVEQQRAVLQRIRGRLLWETAEVFPARLWEAEKQLAQLDAALKIHDQRQLRLQQLLNRPSQQHIQQQHRQQQIDDQERRIESLLESVEIYLRLANDTLKQQIVDELERQQLDVKRYLAQARLGVARIYDAMLVGQGVDR